MTDRSRIQNHEDKGGRHAPRRKTLEKMAHQARRRAIAAAKRAKLGPESPPKLSEDMDALLVADEGGWPDVAPGSGCPTRPGRGSSRAFEVAAARHRRPDLPF